MPDIAPGAIPSPNIWRAPQTYEVMNRGIDVHGVAWAAMTALRSWAGATILDVGCGTGYHLPHFATTAAQVIGVDPHAGLVSLARTRVRALSNVEVCPATAQSLPLPSGSVDVAHARWAYFFGPGCEPGLAELSRVVRRGGAALILDIDASRGVYGTWFRRWLRSYDPAEVERFWSLQGFSRERLDMRWAFSSRADLEAVVKIEFPASIAQAVLAEISGRAFDYAANLWWRYY